MIDDEDALFSLPPEEFVAARDDLAGRLKDRREAERAKDVRALRRPTVAAWAVNLAVRRAPEQLDALVELHRELVRAQRQMLSGVKRADAAGLARSRREAVDAMVDTAADAVAEHDRDLTTHREDVRATFEALLADPESAPGVREGRLQKALPAPAGFGTLAGLALVAEPEEPGPEAPEDAAADLESADEGATAEDEGAAGPSVETQTVPGQTTAEQTAEDRAAAERRAAEAQAQAKLEEARALRADVTTAAEEALSHARNVERRAARLREQAETAEAEAARTAREAEAARARAERAAGTATRARSDADTATGRAERARARADEVVEELQQADALLESLEEATAHDEG